MQTDAKRDKEEIAKLGLAAKEGFEAAERAANLEVQLKGLKEENTTLVENFNSERVCDLVAMFMISSVSISLLT